MFVIPAYDLHIFMSSVNLCHLWKFPSFIISFISFSCLVELTRTSSTIEVAREDWLTSFLILRGKTFNLSPTDFGRCTLPTVDWENSFLFLIYCESLITIRCRNLSNTFSVSLSVIRSYLFIYLLMNYMYWFFECWIQLCIPDKNPSGLWMLFSTHFEDMSLSWCLAELQFL